MEIKQISTEKSTEPEKAFRPQDFSEFIWQKEIKKIIQTAINSACKRESNIWHILFSWESGYWKTTLSQIISKELKVNIKIVTWYAITKPSEIISILNNLEKGDILFIDEIHRIKPNIEEILYVAMEDYAIDMVMNEGWNVRIPINYFSLIWATTKLESLSNPLKNRFVYKFHFIDYSEEEKKKIIEKHLDFYWIDFEQNLIPEMSNKIVSIPREINNFCVKLRDYLISKSSNSEKIKLNKNVWENFINWSKIENWGLSNIHKIYLETLKHFKWWPVWLKTISLNIGLNEKAVENDIEPLLFKLWKIEKTSRGRILKD